MSPDAVKLFRFSFLDLFTLFFVCNCATPGSISRVTLSSLSKSTGRYDHKFVPDFYMEKASAESAEQRSDQNLEPNQYLGPYVQAGAVPFHGGNSPPSHAHVPQIASRGAPVSTSLSGLLSTTSSLGAALH